MQILNTLRRMDLLAVSALVGFNTSSASAIQGGIWNPMFRWSILRRDFLYGKLRWKEFIFGNSATRFVSLEVEIGRSEAINGLRSSMALRQIGIKLKPRRNFGFFFDGLLP